MLSVFVDGNALMWRAAYGMGTANNAVSTGIFNLLSDVLEMIQPNRLIVFWDDGKSRWRVLCYPDYKAQRAEKREKDEIDVEAVFSQAKDVQRILTHFGVSQLCVKGVEADDLIGWLSEYYYETEKDTVVIISSDKDLWQLIKADENHQVIVFDPLKKMWINSLVVREFLGVWPHQVRDFKALAGDVSDNIPGAKGVGPKTAAGVLDSYGSAPVLYTDEVVSSLKKKKATDKILFYEDEVESAYRIVGIPKLSEAGYTLTSSEFESIRKQLVGEVSVDSVRSRLLIDSLGSLRLDFSKVPKRAANVTTNFFQIYQNDPVSFEGMDKTILECSKCPLRNDCGEHGPTLAEGYSDAEIMVIGRNPGKNELLEGRPFVGMSGKRLDDLFREVGLTRRECWITNVCKCYSLNNRPLEFSEMTACLPYLRAEITALKPKLILAFGNEAQAAVSPYGASGITSRSGEILEPFTHGWVGDVEATVMLFPHPSAAMRSQKAEMLFQFAEKRLKVFLDGKQIKNN